MSYAVEDRLPLLGAAVQVTRAITPDGKNILTPEPPGLRAPVRGLGMQMSPLVTLVDTPEGIKGPVTLEGGIRLTLAVGRKEVRIDKVFDGQKKTAGQDDVEIALTSAAHDGDVATISLQIKTNPEKGHSPSYDSRSGFGFALVDAQGKRIGRITGWSQTGGPDNARLSLTVSNVPEGADDLTLVFAFPDTVETKEFPFTLKDVPLP
jgi:hypothetical protein